VAPPGEVRLRRHHDGQAEEQRHQQAVHPLPQVGARRAPPQRVQAGHPGEREQQRHVVATSRGPVLELAGEVDRANAELVAALVHRTAEAYDGVVPVALDRLAFGDIGAVRAMRDGSRPLRERGGRLRLVHPRPVL
jgi:anti-anti-sigma regulatory factor